MTRVLHCTRVLEVSCAVQDLSCEQRREACRRVGIAGWLISGQAGDQLYLFYLPGSRWLIIGYELVKGYKIVKENKSRFLCAITCNGPAIKWVNVAESNGGRTIQSWIGAECFWGRNERSTAQFLQSWYKLSGLYAFRGTNLLMCWLAIILLNFERGSEVVGLQV